MTALAESARAHLEDVESWLQNLESFDLAAALAGGLGPHEVAFLSVDVIEGFTRVGALASPRVTAIIPRVTRALARAHELGVRDIALIHDAHPENAEEFEAYPPHCLAGSLESRHVIEMESVPGFASWQRFEKNSIASLENTGLRDWLEARPQLKLLVALGDVTDLCLYSLALGLKLRSIAANLGQQVIVPANCTDTWDSPDHPADLYHSLFLRQLARNGVRVVKELL